MGFGGWEAALTTIVARSTFIFIFDYVENEAGAWRMRMRQGFI